MAQFRYVLMIASILVLTSLNASIAEDTATKYRDLVKQLVSPNTKPKVLGGDKWRVKLPKDYDVAAQQRIDAARTEIHEHIEEALPHLVEALDDNRYCMTVRDSKLNSVYNASVQIICRRIIASHLQIYKRKIRLSGLAHSDYYNYGPFTKEWLAKRKHRTLVELQLEAINWAIQKRENEPEGYRRDGNTGENEINELIQMRDEIAESKTPKKPDGLADMIDEDLNVP